MAKVINGHDTLTVIVPVEEFIISTLHVPPNMMSGGEIIRTFIKSKLANTKYSAVIADFETPPNRTSVTERFVDGNFIVTWRKE